MVVMRLSPDSNNTQMAVFFNLLPLSCLVMFICHFTLSNHGTEEEQVEGLKTERVITHGKEGKDVCCSSRGLRRRRCRGVLSTINVKRMC